MVFRTMRQAVGGQEVRSDDWTTTANVMRDTGGTELGVSRKNVEKETWWWNEEVQEFVEEKRLTKKWESERTEESRQKQKTETGLNMY